MLVCINFLMLTITMKHTHSYNDLYKTNKFNYSLLDKNHSIKTIYFVRHGETQWNAEKRSQGDNDIPINSNGREQATLTGLYFDEYIIKDHKIDIIFTSPSKRAYETAHIISKNISYHPNIVVLDDLREHRSGIISGTTQNERDNDPRFQQLINLQNKLFKANRPIQRAKLYDEIDKEIVILGGESFDDDQKRSKRLIEFLSKQSYNTIICVTHGGTIDAILMYLTHQIDPCKGNSINGSNCTIMCIELKLNDKNEVIPRIISHPNTLHIGLMKSLNHK